MCYPQTMALPTIFRILVLYLHYLPALLRDQYVLQLTDTNFALKLHRTDHLLTMFFVPWSGNCQKFRPHFARAAIILKRKNFPMELGKMDCSGKGRATCEAENIGLKYPVFKYYYKGEFIKEYTGSMDYLGIVKFMRTKVYPAVTEIHDVQQFKKFLVKLEDPIVIGFFEEESRLKNLFFRVAEQMKELIIFGYSKCEKLLRKVGVTDGVLLFRPESLQNRFEAERELYDGRVIIGELRNFIISSYHGLVGYRTPNNANDFPTPVIILYYTVDYNGEGREAIYWRYRIMAVAHKYKNYVKFALSAKDDFEEELFHFPVDYTNIMQPFVLGQDLENKQYVMTEDFSRQHFDDFVNGFVHQNITPYFKSKHITQESDGLVIIAVAKNFDEVVVNSDNDVLLELYAPWSGRCRMFAPVLREVASLLQEDRVVVVKMDITENALPQIFEDRSVPNVYWLSKGRKDHPILFQGSRTVGEVMKFIARHASEELRHYDRYGVPRDEIHGADLDRDEL